MSFSTINLTVLLSLALTGGVAPGPGSPDGRGSVEAAAGPPAGPRVGAPADSVRGRTIRWTWTQGPVAGVTHEHEFRPDGSVEWRVLSGPQKGHSAVEEEYAVYRVAESVSTVSYRAASGYTLTVTLNFTTGEMFGFASGEGRWYPGRGTFEVVR